MEKKDSIKIFFFGDLKSPFIRQDRDLLNEDCRVGSMDLSVWAKSFWLRNVVFPVSCLWASWDIATSDLVWIWFADYPGLPILLLAKLFGKPVVINIGGWEVSRIPEIGYGNQLNPIRGWISRLMIVLADVCIVPSESYRNITLNLMPLATVRVIPNWIDNHYCTDPLPEKKPACVTAYCTSQTYKLKGIDTFQGIKAMRSPCEMKEVKNVPHEELINILKDSKVYFCGSVTESFGVTVLEAMACGCVPVVPDRDNLPDLIGDSGVVFIYGDTIGAYKAIYNALTMDGQPARERAKQFSKERKQGLVRELIKELV